MTVGDGVTKYSWCHWCGVGVMQIDTVRHSLVHMEIKLYTRKLFVLL